MISQFEDKAMELTQSAQQIGKIILRSKDSLRDLGDVKQTKFS